MLTRIVSGGQTGADRAALDVALAWGVPCGGWVPRRRRAEDGTIPDRYPDLQETESDDAAVRTERNVRDSDGTLIVSHGPLAGGSLFTLQVARRLGRPALHVDMHTLNVAGAVAATVRWLREHDVATLNVAGPRESGDDRVYLATVLVLSGILGYQRGAAAAG